MTEQETNELAAKRNAHKGKSLSHKTWRAKQVDGEWKVVLEDTVSQSAATAMTPSMDRLAAMAAVGQAILDGMPPEEREAFKALAHEHLMAKVRRTLGSRGGLDE
jgi:hypothetical protein